MAAVAMVALVGGLAMVVDTGMFFVIQRQMQSAADAGALAGAWHKPICASDTACFGPDGSAQVVAREVALANAAALSELCIGGVNVPVPTAGTPLNRPVNVNAIVVTAECDAAYSFGRILGLSSKHISASAAAAIGDRDGNGDMGDFTMNPAGCTDPTQCRIARLIE
jgi:hypothetical protein